jgi:hypothetical protein
MGSLGWAVAGFVPTDLQGVTVLDNPLQGFAFLQFQSLSQRRRTDEVKLPVFAPSLDNLKFRKITHGYKLATTLVISIK